MKNMSVCSRSIKNTESYPLQNPLLPKDTCTPMFTAASFIIAKTWKQPKCPSTDEWIKEMWYILQWNITKPQKIMK